MTQKVERFGEKLRTLRMQRGLTLKQLALQLGYVAHGYISELEAGKKTPTVEFALSVARLFNVMTDQLLQDHLEIDLAQQEHSNMSLALVDRPPTLGEIEKLRLVLSTYQDGSGQLEGGTLPGWRDFERAVAAVFGGEAQESKYIFDVLLPDPQRLEVRYGLACKMRRELDRIVRDGRVTIELSNSAGEFWRHLGASGIDPVNYRDRPNEVGAALIDLINQWHLRVNLNQGGTVDLERSSYLVLSWNRAGWYQLHQFPLALPDPATLKWYCPIKNAKGVDQTARRIIGEDATGTLFEWYGESGGQLKYYPLAENARWASERFRLEPLSDLGREHTVLIKAAQYFPQLWEKACRS